MDTSFLVECYPSLSSNLLEEIENIALTKQFNTGDYIVKQGDYIRYLPIVLEGNVKVYTTENDIQFLLYYIAAGESCIYSFAHTLSNKPAEFSAKAESNCTLLLLPKHKVNEWLKKYPNFGSIVITDYQKQYQSLLDTTKQLVIYNLDKRLLNYLQKQVELTQNNKLTITHQKIADDLGTSREVITRILKKLSVDNKIEQIGRAIKVL